MSDIDTFCDWRRLCGTSLRSLLRAAVIQLLHKSINASGLLCRELKLCQITLFHAGNGGMIHGDVLTAADIRTEGNTPYLSVLAN
jgi:hypothetical protein